MLDGRFRYAEEIMMGERHAELMRQSEAIRLLDELYGEKGKRPSRLRGAAGWFGNQLVRAGSYLVSLSQPDHVSSECIEMT